jgi:cystathionine gamma-synthase
MKIESRLAQIGSRADSVTGAVSFPVYNATVYRHPGLGQSTGFDYARTKNPTRSVLEEAFADLESADAAFAFISGMAALQTVLALFNQGDHLLVSLDLYGGTYRLIEQVLTRFGLSADYADTNDIAVLESLRKPNTKAILIETPTNPLMMVTDIAAVSAWAKQNGILSIVDNTLLTPYYQRPLELGADIVVHSATKYLGGHNDVLAGLVAVKGSELAERVAFLQNSIGAVLGPQDSWLLMRGLKTLALRMERHQENAIRIAHYLREHPLVETVYYPALADHPGHEVQKRQAGGNSGLLSFRVRDARLVSPILGNIRLIAFAESMGGTESLMTFPAVQTHADIPEDIRRTIGVDDRLLRLSVGIEHVDDLIADLDRAFRLAQEELTEQAAKVGRQDR